MIINFYNIIKLIILKLNLKIKIYEFTRMWGIMRGCFFYKYFFCKKIVYYVVIKYFLKDYLNLKSLNKYIKIYKLN